MAECSINLRHASLGHCPTAVTSQILRGQRVQVWDYAGDGYVHRLIQSKTDGKLVEVAPPRADDRADASCSRRADTMDPPCRTSRPELATRTTGYTRKFKTPY